jgi:hypothetical protein
MAVKERSRGVDAFLRPCQHLEPRLAFSRGLGVISCSRRNLARDTALISHHDTGATRKLVKGRENNCACVCQT